MTTIKKQVEPFADEAAERVVIASLLNGSVSDFPDAELFFHPSHRAILRALAALRLRGVPADIITLTQELRENGELENAGGAFVVTQLETEYAAKSPEIVAFELSRLHELRAKREARRIGEQLVRGDIDSNGAQQELAKLLSLHKTKTNWLETIDAGTVGSAELAHMTLPKREPLLGDWLCEGDYGIIFSPRGIGKTWFGELIAKTVSTGGRVGEWEAPRPAKVLYIDGEMPADLMRDRDKGLGSGEVEYLNHSILFDRTEQVLNITESEVQEAILQKCIRDNVKLVIIDNLSTLASGIKENDSYEWERLQNWLLQFRRHKIAVILIHHSGRSGEIRGTSKREDAAFWIIALDDAKKNSDDKRGARFISRFTKPSRNTQEEIPPYEWHIVTDQTTGEVSVGCKPPQTMDVFRQCIADGVTDCTQLPEEMRVSKGTISKWATKAVKEGWLRKDGREYVLVERNRETTFRVVEDGNEGNEK
jgi:AAA domain/DnaB-like helicase N terminal domain